MSRCLYRAFCGVVFLCSGANLPVFAAELPVCLTTPDALPTSDAVAATTGSTFDQYRIELGGEALSGALKFDDESPSPLFTAPADSNPNATRLDDGQGAGGDSGASEWDYLWRKASRIPITSIPEPTTTTLLVGGAILLWAGRKRRHIK